MCCAAAAASFGGRGAPPHVVGLVPGVNVGRRDMNSCQLKAKETKKCLHRDVYDDDLVEFCQL
jgi:hypothetical protein